MLSGLVDHRVHPFALRAKNRILGLRGTRSIGDLKERIRRSSKGNAERMGRAPRLGSRFTEKVMANSRKESGSDYTERRKNLFKAKVGAGISGRIVLHVRDR